MTKLSTHKRWKGCCMMCGVYLNNAADRHPVGVLRRTGMKRKMSKRAMIDKATKEQLA